MRGFFRCLSLNKNVFLLKKKDPGIKVDDIIWISEQGKLEALAKIAADNPNTIFIAWFDETMEKLSQHFMQNGLSTNKIYPAQRMLQHQLQNTRVVFIEHYPLHDK